MHFFFFNGCCGLSWDIEEKENKFKTYPSSFKVINKLIFILQGQFVHLQYSSFKVRLWYRLSMAEKKSKLVQIKFFIGSSVYIGYKRFRSVLIGSRLIGPCWFSSVLIGSHRFSSVHIGSRLIGPCWFSSVLIRSHPFSSVHIGSHQFSSVHVGSHQFSLVLDGSHWSSSVIVGSHPFTLVHVGSCVLVGSNRFLLVLVGSCQFTSVLIGSCTNIIPSRLVC